MIEAINPYTAKIIITAKDNDSIRAISKRINASYAWTHQWVEKLVGLGIIARRGQKIKINKKNIIYKEFTRFIKKALEESLSLADAYSLPNLAGLEYAYTETDAVFIWTKGGYNIGRDKTAYPIFIEVVKEDISKWADFFDGISIKCTARIERKKGIYFILIAKKMIEKEEVNGVSVIPLNRTVEYAKKYIYNFEPALEMLDSMYKLDTGIKYAEKGVR